VIVEQSGVTVGQSGVTVEQSGALPTPKKQKVVIALGGNALGKNLMEQRVNVAKAATPIADIIEAGYDVVICHGNGPQIGMIDLAFETAAKSEPSIHPMPLSTGGAMSQGYIGFGIQKALYKELRQRGIEKSVAAIVTQVVVDPDDPAFKEPSKPIGNFYTEDEAQIMMEIYPEVIMKEDSGRGWRRMVSSPEPLEIIEAPVITSMLACGHVAVACGGGGLPVIREGDGLIPWEAVIDKDLASELLADLIGADMLVILTSVDKVAVDFGTPQQRDLDTLTVSEAAHFIEQGQFAAGSMLPKVLACLRFIKARPEGVALITSLERVMEGIIGTTGTRILV